MYYELKIIVPRQDAKGRTKKVTEHYITDCQLFAEAELKGYEQAGDDGEVFFICRSKAKELVNEIEEDKHVYRATLTETFVIDDKGTMKEQHYQVLVSASSLDKANSLMKDYVAQGLNDMTLDSIVGTKILAKI